MYHTITYHLALLRVKESYYRRRAHRAPEGVARAAHTYGIMYVTYSSAAWPESSLSLEPGYLCDMRDIIDDL